MADKYWTLTVSYVNGVASITDGNGGTGDETIFANEEDQATFQPGTGVKAVTAFRITSPIPLPRGVTVTQTLDGNDCVVLDANRLESTANQVDVKYCIHFTDSNGVDRTTDPQLINKPTTRPPTMLAPKAKRAAGSSAAPAALARYSRPSTAGAAAKPSAKPLVKSGSAKTRSSK
jgi:hypothetical protein